MIAAQRAADLTTPQKRLQEVSRVWHLYHETYKGSAAITIQAAWRGYAARKRRHATRTGHLLRNADPRGREARDCAARVIQRWWRGVMARAQVRYDLAAIRRVQGAWRGRVARFAYPALRRAWRRRNEAAIEVQRYVRGYLARIKVGKVAPRSRMVAARHAPAPRPPPTLQDHAATTIQRFYRGWKGRKRAVWVRAERRKLERYLRRDGAARVVQAAWRGWRVRRLHPLPSRRKGQPPQTPVPPPLQLQEASGSASCVSISAPPGLQPLAVPEAQVSGTSSPPSPSTPPSPEKLGARRVPRPTSPQPKRAASPASTGGAAGGAGAGTGVVSAGTGAVGAGTAGAGAGAVGAISGTSAVGAGAASLELHRPPPPQHPSPPPPAAPPGVKPTPPSAPPPTRTAAALRRSISSLTSSSTANSPHRAPAAAALTPRTQQSTPIKPGPASAPARPIPQPCSARHSQAGVADTSPAPTTPQHTAAPAPLGDAPAGRRGAHPAGGNGEKGPGATPLTPLSPSAHTGVARGRGAVSRTTSHLGPPPLTALQRASPSLPVSKSLDLHTLRVGRNISTPDAPTPARGFSPPSPTASLTQPAGPGAAPPGGVGSRPQWASPRHPTQRARSLGSTLMASPPSSSSSPRAPPMLAAQPREVGSFNVIHAVVMSKAGRAPSARVAPPVPPPPAAS